MNYKERYLSAHTQWFKRTYPMAFKDGHYTMPTIPKIKNANGLTKFILNFIKYDGYRATRVSSAGRYIEAKNEQGHKIAGGGMFIPSTTRRGAADLSCTIKGRSVMIEIKIGNDKPSEYQLREQQLERVSGGIYEFISTPEEFFELYDKIINL
jgi:hypothetical protein